MKVTAVFLAYLVQIGLGNVLNRRGITTTSTASTCNRDNCFRAVAGTSPGVSPSLSVRQSECSSFMKTTVTPAPVTMTIYIQSQPTPARRDIDYLLAARQFTTHPASIPTYASFCSVAIGPTANPTSRYSSACSCFGITAVTSYAPTPTVTVTTTAACSNPQTCGTYASCGITSADCFCGLDTDNKSICFQSESCDTSLQCSSNADCVGKGNKTSCLLDNCCGFNICSPTDVCSNLSNPSRLFKDRDNAGKRHGCVISSVESCED